MESYLYFCTECNKLFKVADTGRKVKCSNCSKPLVDLEIKDTDYAALDMEKREALKNKARGNEEDKAEDTAATIPEEETEEDKEPEKQDRPEKSEHTSMFDINALLYGGAGIDAPVPSADDTAAADPNPVISSDDDRSSDPDTDTTTNPETDDVSPDTDTDTVPDTETDSDSGTYTDTAANPDSDTDAATDEALFSAFFNIEDSFRDPYMSENDNKEEDSRVDEEGTDKVNTFSERIAENSAKISNEIEKQNDEIVTVKNNYLKIQIQSQLLAVDNFMSICKLSALQDDGVVDKDEEKLLKKLEKAAGDYKKALNKLI